MKKLTDEEVIANISETVSRVISSAVMATSAKQRRIMRFQECMKYVMNSFPTWADEHAKIMLKDPATYLHDLTVWAETEALDFYARS